MNYSPTEMTPMKVEPDLRRREQFQLTPEENQILKDCSQEGIYKRAIPTGISFSVIGFFVAKSGPLCHAKFGPKPAMFGFGVMGYMLGRFSYSKVCIERALAVPNGNLRKIFPQLAERVGLPREDSQNQFYEPIDMSPEPTWEKQSTTSDIEMPSVSNFDTVPSDYYVDIKDDPPVVESSKSYTSHEELRRQNRQEYTNKMYGEGRPMAQRYAEYPQEGVHVRRREAPPQPTQQEVGGSQKTKYGDVWDV